MLSLRFQISVLVNVKNCVHFFQQGFFLRLHARWASCSLWISHCNPTILTHNAVCAYPPDVHHSVQTCSSKVYSAWTQNIFQDLQEGGSSCFQSLGSPNSNSGCCESAQVTLTQNGFVVTSHVVTFLIVTMFEHVLCLSSAWQSCCNEVRRALQATLLFWC